MRQTTASIHTARMCLKVLLKLKRSGPVYDQVVSALSEGRYERLYDGSIKSPDPAQSLDTFCTEYFAYNILRKYPFKGVNRKQVAIDTFIKMEQHCRESNQRLSYLYRTSPSVRDQIFWLREKIDRCLGRFSWNDAERFFSWGPGATTRLKNTEGDVYFKFRGKPETTLNNLPLACAAVGRIPLWFGEIHPLSQSDMFHVVAGSKVTTVPKDAKTDRPIAIEPDMNMFMQKSIGTMIRSRLRRVGVDLNDQTRNQRLAGLALENGLATIDLSSASDTVCSELVELLLPDDWLAALKQCRSARYVLNNSMFLFEKFSTMGNGYTFELESLLFWAISSLSIEETFVADRTLAVYGDDIIIHSYASDRLLANLNTFGFIPNREKSFTSGLFYESCGTHYFRGADITAVFVKEPLDHPSRLTWFANSIARWGERAGRCGVSHIVGAWEAALSEVPADWQLPIPDGVGDGGVVMLFTDHTFDYLNGGLSTDYQAGCDFMHHVLVRRPLKGREPSDIPYLLRGLYRLESKPSPTRELSLKLDDAPSNPLAYEEVWELVSSWVRSWRHEELATL